MARIKIAEEYKEEWLEIERPQPLSDNYLDSLSYDVLTGKLDSSTAVDTYDKFKHECKNWILESSLNHLTGFENFLDPDIMIGCTQFIDNIYMQRKPQVVPKDYKYHERLGNWATHIGTLSRQKDLIIALPFPYTGGIHPEMNEILDECLRKSISVHIDGAWISSARDINFDFSHPAIESVGISLSKGMGLGWNRIGLRWYKNYREDSITAMNRFDMHNRALVMIGLHYIRSLPSDYLWNKHGERYYKVCEDFNLTPTNSIHLALRDDLPVGVSPLIRYLENYES